MKRGHSPKTPAQEFHDEREFHHLGLLLSCIGSLNHVEVSLATTYDEKAALQKAVEIIEGVTNFWKENTDLARAQYVRNR